MRIVKKTLICGLFIVGEIFVFSQTKIVGRVVDTESQNISGAIIKVENTDILAYTDDFGEFKIDVPTDIDVDTLVILKNGYKKVSKKIVSSSNNDLRLITLEKDNVREIEELLFTIERMADMNRMKIKKLENPIFSSTIGHKLIEKRNVYSIEDALKSTTGVSAVSRYGGFISLNMRGMSDVAYLIDGIRDERITFSFAPISNIVSAERIEVLKGPESVLFGHSVLGGIINVIRKTPSHKLKAVAKFDFGSYNYYGGYIGVGGPISKNLRYRFDFGLTRTDGWRNHSVDTNNGSLVLDYTPTKKDAFQLSIQANDDKYNTESGLPTEPDVPGNLRLLSGINRSTRYNHPEDIMTHKRKDVRLKYTRKFNENIEATNVVSFSDDDIFYISNDGGLTVNPERTTIERTTIGFNHRAKPIQNQFDFSYKFKIGRVDNKIIAGNYLSSLIRKSHTLGFEGPGVTSILDLYNPKVNTGDREHWISRTSSRKENVASFYLQNWLSISNKFKLLLGGRYDHFYSHYWVDNFNKNNEYIGYKNIGKGTFNVVTYRTGLVYIPTTYLSLFGSYSTYFKPTRRFDKEGNVYAPEKGFQGELGIKIQKDNKINLNLSTYYILKHNILERVGVNQFRYLGSVESKGFEVDANFQIIEGLFIKTGYAFTNAKVKEGNKKGFAREYIPKHLFNMWMDYTFHKYIKGLNVGLGANYMGKNFSNSDNIYTVPGYFLLDGVVSYKLNNNIRIGLNVNNILNKKYFSSSIPNFDVDPERIMVVPGAGRNFKISVGYQF